MDEDKWIVYVSLPVAWRDAIDTRLKEKGFSSYAEYVRYLVRRDLGYEI